MRILGQITTFEDNDVLDHSLRALLEQTRPLDEILIVDNASQDDTLKRHFPPHVTVIRHAKNSGTNGAVITGFRYALEQGYEWIWIFDADSAPQADALERLLELRDSLGREAVEHVSFLACLPVDRTTGIPHAGARLSVRGMSVAASEGNSPYYACDVMIWSGCLYQLSTVRDVGLPNPDYVLDWGEFAYGLQCRRKGYLGFVDTRSVMHHNIRGASFAVSRRRIAGFSFTRTEMLPIRCYYRVRNCIYFWLYDNPGCSLRTLGRRGLLPGIALTMSFLVHPRNHAAQIIACLRGLLDGLTGRLDRRY